MRRKNFFGLKFIAVTMLLGLFSPSVTLENGQTLSQSISENRLDLSEGLIAGLSTTNMSISLFTQAEARRKHRRGHRRVHRRSHRRANYRHHRRSHHRRHHRRNVVGAAIAGAVVGAAVSSAVRRSNCETLYVRGLRYQDCGNGLIRY